MKKTLGTIVAAAAVVLLTATFGFAEYAAAGATNFPYFQLGCLIVGGLILVSLKRKYNKMYTAEVVGAFALYTILMALFTNPVIDAVKTIVLIRPNRRAMRAASSAEMPARMLAAKKIAPSTMVPTVVTA